MGFFYFDESIHPAAGFILGAWVGSETDPTTLVKAALLRAGLQPGVDEYKSGARMAGNPIMARAREELAGVVRQCGVGVVILPDNRRQDVGLEAIRALRKILVSTGLGLSGHAVFLDQGLIPNRPRFDDLVGHLELSDNALQIEQDSVLIAGLQVADLVAHTCATTLRAQMGLVTKKIRPWVNSENGPDDDVDLAFALWVELRGAFFGAPPPPPQEWRSQFDWQTDVESRGLYISDSCTDELRTRARQRFGRMYLGCIS